ncbi:MAG: ATP-binding cassette domain-containing protein [Zestosphaera sp.]
MSSQTLFSPEKTPLGSTPLISVRGLWKNFPGVVSLKNVNLDILAGEIHALLGENGAGKSTLVKILYGIYVPDRGDIMVNGERVLITSPLDAMRRGIVLVSQVPQLVESLTVVENLALSLRQFGMMSSVVRVERFLAEKASEYGVKIDPNTEVWRLSYTQKQMVEIVRALLLNAKVIAFDEATTLLPQAEKRKLYDFARLFKSRGGSILLITHRIPEAMEVSDRITVLRKGEVVGTVRPEEVDVEQVRAMMFGDRLVHSNSLGGNGRSPGAEEVVKITDLWVRGDYGAYAVREVSLTVRRGEILGIAGVAGNGQLELIQSLAGLRRVERGRISIRVGGKEVDVTNKGPALIRALGVGYIPDEPVLRGVSADNTIEENLALHPRLSGFIINWRSVRGLATNLIKDYNIAASSTAAKVKVLSGGNLMKVLVARELTVAENLLLAYNPTRGLDEVSAHYVRRLVRGKTSSGGMSAIIASEDLDEIVEMCDAVAVISSGRVLKVFRSAFSRDEIERIMVS